MKKKISTLLFILLLFTLLILILTNSKEILISANNGLNIWKETIFPSLFPFFIISDLLINYGIVELLGELLKKITYKLFYLPKEAAFIIIISILTGAPSNAKYINELLINNKITEKEAEYLLTFTHFSNPLFVIGTIGTLLNSIKIGFIIWIIHVSTNFLIGLIIRKRKNKYISKINIKNELNNIYIKRKNNNFIKILTESIIKNINTLILILGIITVFLVLNTIITNILNTSEFNKSIIGGILEITQGINNISILNINIKLKAAIITSFLSFGGISIHTQVFSILSNTRIKYKYYLTSRIIHALISGILVYLII